MAETERVICSSDALLDSGLGVRFATEYSGRKVPAFVVRYEGQVHAFVNRCPHSQTVLDSDIGRFFESEGLLLTCPVHGATFLPDSGKCVGGPCVGSSLTAITVEERDGNVILKESEHG